METKKITPKEQLHLITSVIEQTRRTLAQNSFYPFLIWGYTTVGVTLVELLLHLLFPATDPTLRLWLWWSIPLIGTILMFFYHRRVPQTRTPLDVNIGAVWGIVALAMLPLFAIVLIVAGSAGYTLLPIILLLIAIGCSITGVLVRMRWVTWGGVASIVGALAICGLIFWFRKAIALPMDEAARAILVERFVTGQLLIFALSLTLSLILPGHYLQRVLSQPKQ